MDKLKLDLQRFALDPPMAGNIIDEVALYEYHQNIKTYYVQKAELDMANDTSGSNWQDMMKNKIDYCISNIDTSKTNLETFINGGWYGINYGFGIFSKIGAAYQLVWFSSNATYYCKKINNNYEYTDIYGITTGYATTDNSYISSAENNHWEKNGKVVSYSFTMTVTGSWSATTQFLSGLPKAQAYTRFMGLNTNNQTIMRFVIDTNGNISNAYSNTTPSSGNVIEGHITYIASE